MADACIASGERFLGLKMDEDANIFHSYDCWPDDLVDAYDAARDDRARVEVACQALDRLQDNGKISEEPREEDPA
jgi:hypothetical protein